MPCSRSEALLTPSPPYRSYHTDRTCAILLINTPYYFSYVWSFVKNLLDENMTKRLRVASSGAQTTEVLREWIDEGKKASGHTPITHGWLAGYPP